MLNELFSLQMEILLEYEVSKQPVKVIRPMSFEAFERLCRKSFKIRETEEIIIQCFNSKWGEFVDITEVPESECRLKIILKKPNNNEIIESEANTSETQDEEIALSPEATCQQTKTRYSMYYESM